MVEVAGVGGGAPPPPPPTAVLDYTDLGIVGHEN